MSDADDHAHEDECVMCGATLFAPLEYWIWNNAVCRYCQAKFFNILNTSNFQGLRRLVLAVNERISYEIKEAYVEESETYKLIEAYEALDPTIKAWAEVGEK